MTSLADKAASDIEARKQLGIPPEIASSAFGPLLLKAVQETETKRKLTVPWKLDEPYNQPYFVFDITEQVWQPREPAQSSAEGSQDQQSNEVPSGPVKGLALYSWNIDMMLPFPEARTSAAIDHIEVLAKELPSTTAIVICIQECTIPHFEAITKSEWIRNNFSVTDIDSSNWTSGHFGTTILIDRRLPITSCFRVHFAQTFVDRDAHFVDVSMGPAGARSASTIRLCNVHLESFDWETPLRPAQMGIISKYIHEDGVNGGIVAGDFNSLQPYDKTLHTEHNLKDAFLEIGGQEDSEAGFTWGLQSPPVMMADGPSRLDKIMFHGDCFGLRCFEIFGRDVELADESQKAELIRVGCQKPWITDHLGVMAELHLTGA